MSELLIYIILISMTMGAITAMIILLGGDLKSFFRNVDNKRHRKH